MNTLPLLRVATAFVCFATLSLAQSTNPKPIEAKSPGYPVELTDTGLSGAAEVDFVVKADGSVADVELAMANHRAFGKAAIAAVKAWRFEPGTRNGAPADIHVTERFNFNAPFDQVINAVAKRKVFTTLTETPLTEKEFPTRKLKVKKAARPIYPRALNGSNIEEKVRVKFVVAPDGTTLNPQIVSAQHKEFEAPAIQAVAMMSYEPPVKDGKPVYVDAVTTLNFSNERAGGRGGRGGFGGGGGGGFGGGDGGGFGGGGGGGFGGGGPDGE